jgi:hypothetical protein
VTAASAVPATVENRPGLPAIAYRIGTFATFRQAILDQLSQTPQLAALATRVSDDYTITAIELWSAVADVVTFYQERTANEAFLGTSTLRDSLLRIVRLVGYELRGGAAATTNLAFTLEPGARALIPAGTRVQSVPGQGETPQKFETLADLAGDGRLNRLRIGPRTAGISPTGQGSTGATVAPDAAALQAASSLGPGSRLMMYSATAVEVLTVRSVQVHDDLLAIDWVLPIAGAGFVGAYDGGDPASRIYRLGRSFHLFGFDTPPSVVTSQLKIAADPTSAYLDTATSNFSLHGDGTANNQLSFDARYDGLKSGATLLAVASLGSGAALLTKAIPLSVTAVGERHVTRNATSTSSGSVTAARTGTITQVTVDDGTATSTKLTNLLNAFGASGDIRDVVVYELLGDPLRFWGLSQAAMMAPETIHIAGERVGWSSVEVARTIEKGLYKPGIVIDVADIAVGRSVIVSAGAGAPPIAATVVSISLLADSLAFSPDPSSASTISQLGLAPDQTMPVTAWMSAPLTSPVSLNAQRQLEVTIGALPPQLVTLDRTLPASATVAQVAAGLQSAIRAALPDAPTFARALAWEHRQTIVIVPGVPGDRLAFSPAADDAATIVTVGLDPGRARFLDGVVSGPVAPLAGHVVNGAIQIALGASAPAKWLVFVNIPASPAAAAAALAAAIAYQFVVQTKETVDGRIVVLPLRFSQAARAFIRLELDVQAHALLDSGTAVLLGNVAPASHGETVHDEIVGDGDAAQAFQRFTLKKKPVTLVPAAVPGGVKSSLQLLVNGVKWTEVPSLYGRGPRDRVFTSRLADDGTTTLLFGDGLTGSRLPTGRANVVARYRQGLGVAGRVAAAKLTTPLDRPTGVKGVTNPTAADGGADPETIDSARVNAPGTIRTFGRAVSLRDFEDTALVAGEVGKASASWVWTGDRRAIHLTIAAQGGGAFSADGLKRIRETLAAERDPNHRLLIDNCLRVAVIIDASIVVDDDHVTADVLAAAQASVLDAMSFDRRRFAEPVYLSDLFRVLQNVEGLQSADVNVLDLKSIDATFRASHGLDPSLGHLQSRLLMLPARPGATTVAVLPAEIAWIEAPATDLTLRATGGLSR